jgi:hypothetical protein
MSLPAKKLEAVAGVEVFAPSADESALDTSWVGKRREKEAMRPVPALPLRWPTTPKERYDVFDTWHDVAMQIVRDAKAGLHVAAAAKKVAQWSSGSIVASNAELAARSGYPSEKTISREVRAYTALGLFLPTFEWKRPDGRKFITVRTLRFALPERLPEWIRLPEGRALSLDTRGPDLEAVSLDTRGPDPLDTRGPATIDHKEGGSDGSA